MKNSLILLLSIITLVNLSSTNINAQDTQGTCRCYCSDKCGPRNSHPGDSPFVDPETGLCFCQMRDKVNYLPNQCDLQPRPSEDELTCCGE